jgi:two-component system sensor histidine kinase BaeS
MTSTVTPPPTGGLPPWLRIDLVRPVTAWSVLLSVGIGLLGDLAVRSGVVGLAGALLVLATSAALLASRRLRTRQARLLVALAPLFGIWFALRTSGWLLPLDVVAAFGLLVLGVSLSSGGSVADLPLAGLLSRAWHATLHAIVVPEALVRLAGTGRPRNPVTWAVVRGMLLAVPIVLVLGLLLVSADAVFASFVAVDLDGVVFEHLFAIVFAAWVFLALARVSSARAPAALPAVGARLGAIEALVVLGSVIVLFGGFAVVQAVAVIGGDDYVRQTTGLTYAEYARSGFFQLLWVAALTITGLLALRAATDRGEPQARRRFAVLSCVVCGLTLLIVAVAVRRLTLYSDAYGLTMLRLYSTIFAIWIGAVLVLLILWLAGLRGDRAWFPAAAAGCGLALLLGLNVANPEALVAKVNMQRPAAVERDTGYLTSGLSDDAVPTIAALLPRLGTTEREDVLARLCAEHAGNRERRFTGWAAWNHSSANADQTRTDLCAR